MELRQARRLPHLLFRIARPEIHRRKLPEIVAAASLVIAPGKATDDAGPRLAKRSWDHNDSRWKSLLELGDARACYESPRGQTREPLVSGDNLIRLINDERW